MRNFFNYLRLFSPLIGGVVVLLLGITGLVSLFTDGPYTLYILLAAVVLGGLFAILGGRTSKWWNAQAAAKKAFERGRFDEALEHCDRMADFAERWGPDDPRYGFTMNMLGEALQGVGEHEEALNCAERGLASNARVWGPDHRMTLASRVNKANYLMDLGRFDEAEELLRGVLELRERQSGPTHGDVAVCLNNLGKMYSDCRRYDQAEPLFRRALDIFRGKVARRSPLPGHRPEQRRLRLRPHRQVRRGR